MKEHSWLFKDYEKYGLFYYGEKIKMIYIYARDKAQDR